MAITKEKKKEILQVLIDKFSKSKSVVFSDYRGLNVSSISDLRNKLREGGAECKVAKKTLMKLAAKENSIEDLGSDVMEGPVSATFSYEDEMAGLKILFKFSKENENLKLLGGIIDGKVVKKDEIIQLAKLPGREELLAKLIGSMNAPVSGFVGVLNNVMSGFVRVLNAYKDSLPAEEVKAEPKPEKDETPAEPTEKKADEPKPEESEEKKEKPAEEPKEEAPAEKNPSDDSKAEDTEEKEEDNTETEDAPVNEEIKKNEPVDEEAPENDEEKAA